MTKAKIKNIFLSILILSTLTLFLFFGLPREESITKIRSGYGRIFPEYISYKDKNGLIQYRVDLKLNENNIKKDPNSEKYYAEYRGTIRPEAFSFK